LKLVLAKEPRQLLDSLPETVGKAQILRVLRALADEHETVASWPTGDYTGGRFTVAGTDDEWKITFHLVEMDETVVSVVAIKKRRTLPWALRFYPKKD
jgi:hypothetical protein